MSQEEPDVTWVAIADSYGRELIRRCENVYLPGDKPEPPRGSRGGSVGED